MDSNLLKVVSFWSAFFIPKDGHVLADCSLIENLRSLLDTLPPNLNGLENVQVAVKTIGMTELTTLENRLNLAMLTLIIENKHLFSEEHSENIDNIVNYFSMSRWQ